MGNLHKNPTVKFSTVVLLAVVVTSVCQAQPIERSKIIYKVIGYCITTPSCRRRCLGFRYDSGNCVFHRCRCYKIIITPIVGGTAVAIPPPLKPPEPTSSSVSPGPPEPTSSSVSPEPTSSSVSPEPTSSSISPEPTSSSISPEPTSSSVSAGPPEPTSSSNSPGPPEPPLEFQPPPF